MRLVLYEGQPTKKMLFRGEEHLTVPSWDQRGLESLLASQAFRSLSDEEQKKTLQVWSRMVELVEMMRY